MGAQIRILQPDSLADALKELVELVKNPEAVNALFESVQKAATLNEEEKKKTTEIRESIRGYEKAVAIFEESKKEFEHEKKHFQANRNQLEDLQGAETKRLDELAKELNQKEANLAEIQKSHAKACAALASEKASMIANNLNAKKALAEKELALTKREANLISETERVTNYENILKEKEAKLKAALG